MTWLRPLLLALPLALAAAGDPALAAPACAVGVPGCCTTDPECDDADLCTGVETCDTGTGTCLGGTALVCDDLDPCTDDACDSGLGRCVTTPATDGTPCNDQNACTQTDTCDGGTCVGGDPVVCDDFDACTVDACIPFSGLCIFGPEEDGFPCDDDDACSQLDVCQSGTCTGTQPVACDDGNACTTDACVPATGACSATPVADTTPCDDGDGCTQTDACVAGTCVGGDPLSCDDGVACTTDLCDDGVCTSTPLDAGCPTGDCFEGRCDPADDAADTLGCVSVPVREGEDCADDGATCTDDVCASGLCVHVPMHAACVTLDPCALAQCMPEDAAAGADGCVVVPDRPDGETCTEDLDPCTRDRCETGVCSHPDVENLAACAPVRDPFRQALVLAAFTAEIRAGIAALPAIVVSRRIALLTQADRIIAGLEAAAAEMNGADPTSDTAKERAEGAFGPLKRLPREAKRLARLLALTAERDPVDPLEAERLRRSADDLRRGVVELKRDVRRLRRALRRFVQ